MTASSNPASSNPGSSSPGSRNPFQTLAGAWNRFWFSPHPPFELAACRIAFFGLLWDRYGNYREVQWHTLRHGGVWKPVGIFDLGVPVFEPAGLLVIYFAMGLGFLGAALGLFTRASMTVSFLTALYVFGLRQNFGTYTGGGLDIVVVILGVLVFSRAGDELSVDRFLSLMRRHRGQLGAAWRAFKEPVPPSGEYLWPLKFAWMMFFMLYFSAGVSKMMDTGLEWASSENLRHLLIRHHFSHFPPTEIGLWVADREWAYKTIGYGSLLVELLCPLGLLSKWLRYPFAVALAGMQTGIYYSLGVSFSAVQLLVLWFVPWALVRDWARALIARALPDRAHRRLR